jgi:FkbM family methyltransferase
VGASRIRSGLRAKSIDVLVRVYGRVAASGLLSRPRLRRAYERGYFVYKRALEAGPISSLEAFVEPGSTVVDAGANVGFFSLPFARWVGSGGRVVAIEPGLSNLNSLQERIARAGFERVVECVAAVAVDFEGESRVELNLTNPTDHRIGDEGEPIRAVTVDSLLVDDPRRVSLIKIDVQGAEAMVIDGARETIETHRPALFLEVDDRTLRRFGSSAAALMDQLTGFGYEPRQLTRDGVGPPISAEDLIAASDEGKGDALFLPRPTGRLSAASQAPLRGT